ncbi:Chromosome (plasmid) partitioning protein ParB [Enhygromyxa salina]|uniref:Chromosome (Plasmid) partitioning protein ParB n=1 Tax=Enhygromyxa salina TaxID=215803 RepID=A0A0C2D3E5_9BACT|nr:ParB/RepB/Spo0J family partition protein [Enhygromyxa salina]KIG14662.1 Chromosome (plasmid) partitioning protein ParB [Enhygromyxa salina]
MSRPKRPALGRGLGALIPPPPAPAPTPSQQAGQVASDGPSGIPKQLAIEAIEANREQPRKRFDDERLRELAQSISAQGIIQPIVVTPLERSASGSGPAYQILAGERRWRAAQLAGLHTVPVVIRDTPEAERLEIALVENLQRADLDVIEEARAFEALIDLHGYTQVELASRVGKDRSSVANALRLLKLPSKVQDLIIEGQLGMGHARALLGLESPAQMRELALEVVRKGMSVRQTEAEVRRRARPEPPAPVPDDEKKRHEIIVRDLEARIRRHLGVQARLRTGSKPKGPGTIELPYADLDELQRLLHHLLGDK